MTAFLFMAGLQFYVNRAKDLIRSKWKWVAGIVVTLVGVFVAKRYVSRISVPPTAPELRTELKVLEQHLAQTKVAYAELDKEDAELKATVDMLKTRVRLQKAEILELESGHTDWAKLTDEEIDARFEAAGL